ncbi:unnamed protein product [Protopolystoma xenopodis]|uniref:Uncharacterized protein n=1 Tax=Protopolystoma xenopodis TaxID=117903 RepID=A0A448WUB5_9PLAT|nr:unnamed protein product [Protopolystoma xenopodis]
MLTSRRLHHLVLAQESIWHHQLVRLEAKKRPVMVAALYRQQTARSGSPSWTQGVRRSESALEHEVHTQVEREAESLGNSEERGAEMNHGSSTESKEEIISCKSPSQEKYGKLSGTRELKRFLLV